MKSADPSWGLPSPDQLRGYRIWDSYFTPAHGHPGRDGFSATLSDMARSERAIGLGHFEKLCLFSHVGIGTTGDAAVEALLLADPDRVLKPFTAWPDQLIGMIQLNANDLKASLAALDRWLRDGPMKGVYFPGGGPGARACSDPAVIPLVERVIALKGVMVVDVLLRSPTRLWSRTRPTVPPARVTSANHFTFATLGLGDRASRSTAYGRHGELSC